MTQNVVQLLPEAAKRAAAEKLRQAREDSLQHRLGVQGVDALLFTDKGLQSCLSNVQTILRFDQDYSGVAYDALQCRTVLRMQTRTREWTDVDDYNLTARLEREPYFMRVPDGLVAKAVESVARERAFDPLCQYLELLQWDGVARIDRWLTTYLGAETNKYTEAVGAKWLISAVARALQPGCKVDHTLVLQGPQGLRKSSALRALAGEAFFTDQLRAIGSRDAEESLQGVWIVEMAELDGLSRAEVTTVKAFLTQQDGRIRKAYGKRTQTFPRRCVFCGTTNDDSFLLDATGNRRFWPVSVSRISVEDIARDRDQLWAETVQRYRDGEAWWLEDEETIVQARKEQQDRCRVDPWHEVVSAYVRRQGRVSIRDVLEQALDIPAKQQGQAEQNRVVRILGALGGQKVRRRVNGVLTWGYEPRAGAWDLGDDPTVPTLDEAVPGGPEATEQHESPF